MTDAVAAASSVEALSGAVDEEPPNRPEDVIEVDEEDIIDDEQVEEFKEQLEALGSYPDKVLINTLSMIAADYKDSKVSAFKLYNVWKHRLLTCTNVQEKMPIIYVLDSILKNVQGAFIPIVEGDVPYQWLSTTYHVLPTVQQQKLHKVYMTWKEYSIFSSVDMWNRMGQCFLPSSASSAPALTSATGNPSIPRNTKDGTLILAKNLRQEMQNILDDMQTDLVNELDKVSLERLADINPELLMNIKRAAEDGINLVSASQAAASTNFPASTNRKSASSTAISGNNKSLAQSQQSVLPSFLIETRTASTVQRSNDWHNVFLQQKKNSMGHVANPTFLMVDDIVQSLQKVILDGCTETGSAANAEVKEDETATAKLYTQRDALSMIQYCGTASAMAQLLPIQANNWQSNESETTTRANPAIHAVSHQDDSSAAMISNLLKANIHAEDFNTEGIKKKSPIAISLLYELGLPFQSTADGKRFRTQQLLSYHLDRIFQQKKLKNQAEAAGSSLERGWYVSDLIWTLGKDAPPTLEQGSMEESTVDMKNAGVAENPTDPNVLFTVPADESRDTCIVCGLKFVMFFDTNEGQYKYRNCREIPVDMEMESDVALENDDEADMQFVHGTCWIGLGEPSALSYDQTIYNAQ